MAKHEARGSFLIRMNPGIHRHLRNEAFRRGISLNRLCIERLEGQGRRETFLPLSADSKWALIVKRIKDTFGSGIEGIILFGSTARGEATSESDIDLLVLLPEGRDLNRELYRKWDEAFRAKEDRIYSPHFVLLPSSVENVGSIWFEAALDGVVLFDREDKVNSFLRKLRGEIADQRIVRKWSHGHPYWLRSP